MKYNGIEYWDARELQKVLKYNKWENFEKVIQKAKIACENTGISVVEHFPDVRKTIRMPKNAEKEINDYKLTRYACYLIAQYECNERLKIECPKYGIEYIDTSGDRKKVLNEILWKIQIM